MKDKTNEELYGVIRSGSEAEAAEAIAELNRREDEATEVRVELEEKKKLALDNALKGAIPAILARNLSHGAGEHACECMKCGTPTPSVSPPQAGGEGSKELVSPGQRGEGNEEFEFSAQTGGEGKEAECRCGGKCRKGGGHDQSQLP